MDIEEIEKFEWFDFSSSQGYGFFFRDDEEHKAWSRFVGMCITNRKRRILKERFSEFIFEQIDGVGVWDFIGQFIVSNSGRLPQRFVNLEVLHTLSENEFAEKFLAKSSDFQTSFVFGIGSRYRDGQFRNELSWWRRVSVVVSQKAASAVGLQKVQLIMLSERLELLGLYGDVRKGLEKRRRRA